MLHMQITTDIMDNKLTYHLPLDSDDRVYSELQQWVEPMYEQGEGCVVYLHNTSILLAQ